jgi:hypothetical protein
VQAQRDLEDPAPALDGLDQPLLAPLLEPLLLLLALPLCEARVVLGGEDMAGSIKIINNFKYL